MVKDPTQDHNAIPQHFIDLNPAHKGMLTDKQKAAGTASKAGKPTVSGDDKILDNPDASKKAKEEAVFDKNRRKWK